MINTYIVQNISILFLVNTQTVQFLPCLRYVPRELFLANGQSKIIRAHCNNLAPSRTRDSAQLMPLRQEEIVRLTELFPVVRKNVEAQFFDGNAAKQHCDKVACGKTSRAERRLLNPALNVFAT